MTDDASTTSPALPPRPRLERTKPAAAAPKGKKGGARPGAGRKQSRLPAEVVTRVGPPPLESPLQMVRWWGKLLGEIGWLRIQGRVQTTLVDDVRALAAAAKTMIPDELRAEVDRLLREQDNAKKNSGAKHGPPTEEQPHGHQPALRRDPR